MKLSFTEISFIRHVLNTTGEVETGPEGKEVLSARRLKDSVEVSQRRHFAKNTKEIIEAVQETLTTKQNEIKQLTDEKKEEFSKENPKEEVSLPELPETATEEEKKEHTKTKKALQKVINENFEAKQTRFLNDDEEIKEKVKKANEDMTEVMAEEHEVDLTDKTMKVVKKYFTEYGEANGWAPADDEAVSSLGEKLK